MKEIKVKARIKDKEKILLNLEEQGCVFSDSIKQVDTVYVKITGNVEDYLKNDHFVRIREKSDGRYIFTVKRPKALGKNLVKTEHESEIKDAKELEQALFLMGYKLSNRVIKVRRTGKCGDYEICLDEVEGLGSFIEIEKMAQEETEHEIVLKELQSFLSLLGVSGEDEVKKGYDILILESEYR